MENKISSRLGSFVALASLLLCQLATAAIQIPFSKYSLRRSATADLTHASATFVVDATVGTPPQPVALQLSTSAWDTWVVDARCYTCKQMDYHIEYDDNGVPDFVWDDAYTDVCAGVSFWPGNSTTYTQLGSTLEYDALPLGDTNGFLGGYITDSIALGPDIPQLENFTMGLVNATNDTPMGILGLGYNHSSHDTFTDRLVAQGLINSSAYSLWMDDPTAATGNLLFGAIDDAKFTGNLSRVQSFSQSTYMIVPVMSINANTTSNPIAILASSPALQNNEYPDAFYTQDGSVDDSSSYLFTAIYSPPDSISKLPTALAEQIWALAGATYDYNLQLTTIPCDPSSSAVMTSLTLQLGGSDAISGPLLTAELADLVVPMEEFNLTAFYYYYYSSYSSSDYYYPIRPELAETCLFGVQNRSLSNPIDDVQFSTTGREFTLGSTLLRRAYSVFDFVNGEVAVAPVELGSSAATAAATASSRVVAFPSYGAAAPGSTLWCDYEECHKLDGNGDGIQDVSIGKWKDFEPVGLLPGEGILGLSLGLAAGLLVLGAVVFYVWRRRQIGKAAATDKAVDVSGVEAAGPSTAAALDTTPTTAGPAATEVSAAGVRVEIENNRNV